MIYKFKVPSNTTATLILKAPPSLEDITINLPHLHRDELIKFVEKEGGNFVFSVLPGTYEIEVKK